MSATRVWASLLDLVLPRACPACNRTLSASDDIWCRACAMTLLESVTPPDRYCSRCGQSVGPYLLNASGCAACRDARLYLDGMARAGPYDGVFREMVTKYKFGRDQHLDRPLGRLIKSAIEGRGWNGEIDALVPVPTTWYNRLRYRFRPAAQLARAVGGELHVPVLPLIRVIGKKYNQMDLPASLRPGNVRGVFKLHPRARPAGARLCIIDDVCTTGATLNEIARVLKKAGAATVYAAVVAKTEADQPIT
ncbi:MAG: phosphoribosyltransferase family protein [Phycisphaerae bacterium]|nr:phosphoribosyltransferase family protein [Phycisphaerae bacterium]